MIAIILKRGCNAPVKGGGSDKEKGEQRVGDIDEQREGDIEMEYRLQGVQMKLCISCSISSQTYLSGHFLFVFCKFA